MEELIRSVGLDPVEVASVLWTWGLRILAALAIFVVGRWVARRISTGVSRATQTARVDPTLTRFLGSVVYMALLVMVILAAVQQLGVPATSFLAILGAAGLAIGLALKDSLSNFSSGVMLVFFRPFRVGDFVEAGGVSGTVEEVTIFNTILRTPDNRIITVPNSLIYADSITNFSAEPTRRIDMVFSIAYDDNVVQAKEIMQSVIDNDERVLTDPAPVIMMLELADSSVNFAVRPWVASGDYWAVRGDLLEGIKSALEDNGLSIPYPQRDVHLIGQVAANG
jgi:small conductance mechanosensitive channel